MLEFATGTKSVSTEWSCTADAAFSATANTTAGKYQLVCDVSTLVAGDLLEIRLYEKCRAGDTQRQLEPTWILSGAQSCQFVSPEYALKNGWDFTIKITSATPRTILWSIRDTIKDAAVVIDTGGITTLSFAAGAIDSASIAANAITSSEFAQSAADLVFGGSGAALAELAQAAPSDTPSPRAALMLLYMMALNDNSTISTERRIKNAAGTVIAKGTQGYDGTTFHQGKLGAGP